MDEHPSPVRVIFCEAVEIADPAARAAYLATACGGDASIGAEVEELLRADGAAGGFLVAPTRPPGAASPHRLESVGDRIGRYQLLQKIGEGGCGVVYLAEQIEPLRRRVALKVIKPGMDTHSVIARFEAERQALALMDHPHIARVLDAGTTGAGRPFFVMELVHGIRVTDYCEQNNLSTQQRLQVFIQVCQAVQHAHQKGIIHRDLKPSNILVTSDHGVLCPKVIDFGIAKATADVQLTERTLQTRLDQFIGTPAYMSPEQAEFNAADIDTRTDIYSLGVLLYELLTGYPPFDTETWLKAGLDTLRQAIRETEPMRPSTRLSLELAALRKAPTDHRSEKPPDLTGSPPFLPPQRGSPVRRRPTKELIEQLRGDLDWIVLKALEKDRTRRYATANAFADDIQRHLNNEPVGARPPNPLYLLRKAIRRHRPAVAVATGIALLLVGGVGFIVRDAARTRGAEKVQRGLREKAEQAKAEADLANQRLQRSLFIREWQDAEQLLDQGKTASALAWFARAAREHPDDATAQTRLLSILTEKNAALPLGPPLRHGSPVASASFTADQQHLVTAADDGRIRVWFLGSEREPWVLPRRFNHPAAAPVGPGNRILVEDQDAVTLWELDGTLVKTVFNPHPVTGPIAVTADGRFAALNCGHGGPQLWDTTELQPIGQPVLDHQPEDPITGLSPDGRYLFGIGNDAAHCAWDVASGKRVWQVNWPTSSGMEWVTRLAVHPGGRQVVLGRAVGAAAGELSAWDFSPDAGAGNVGRSTTPAWVLPTRSRITAVTFSRAGDCIFAGDAEGHFGSVSLAAPEWQMLNGEHDGRVHQLELSANGRILLTASGDGTARLWDVRMKSPAPVIVTNGSTIWDAKFSPDSRWFVTAGALAAEIRDTTTGALRRRLPLKRFVTHVDISPDGRRVLACDDAGESCVWDAGSGTPLFAPLRGHPAHHVEFSRDGRWFLVVTSHRTVQVHESATGRQVTPELSISAPAVSAHFGPNARWLIATTEAGDVEFWSLPEGRRMDRTLQHKDVIWTARFSHDQHRLLTASRDRTAALWDIESGRMIREFRHDQQVFSAAFSPDSRRIVTGDASHRAHVWDADSGKRLFELLPHPGGVWYGEFSADGRALLTGDDAGNARLWDAQSGLPLGGWVHTGRSLKRTLFSPDGRWALAASEFGALRVWPVLLAPTPAPAWLPELAEAVAGRRLQADGTLEPVPAERWQMLNTALASLESNEFYARWAHWLLVERMEDQPAAFVP